MLVLKRLGRCWFHLYSRSWPSPPHDLSPHEGISLSTQQPPIFKRSYKIEVFLSTKPLASPSLFPGILYYSSGVSKFLEPLEMSGI